MNGLIMLKGFNISLTYNVAFRATIQALEAFCHLLV